jgi:hypothetical protein
MFHGYDDLFTHAGNQHLKKRAPLLIPLTGQGVLEEEAEAASGE